MIEITNEQRNAVDQQIRDRFEARMLANPVSDLPITAMIHARVRLGLGIRLENACPYMRDCNNKTPSLCIEQPYRVCSYYKLRLAGDIMDGSIDLDAVGLK